MNKYLFFIELSDDITTITETQEEIITLFQPMNVDYNRIVLPQKDTHEVLAQLQQEQSALLNAIENSEIAISVMFSSAKTPSENTRNSKLKIYTADSTGNIFLNKLLRENSITDRSAYEVVVPDAPVWETLRIYYSQMQELEAFYSNGGQRIKNAHEILQKNTNEFNKLIHASNAEAINILLEYCSQNLKAEIQTQFDGDKYVFSSME